MDYMLISGFLIWVTVSVVVIKSISNAENRIKKLSEENQAMKEDIRKLKFATVVIDGLLSNTMMKLGQIDKNLVQSGKLTDEMNAMVKTILEKVNSDKKRGA